MEKVDSIQKQMGNLSRDKNPKKEPKRDARKKASNRNKECL